MAKVTSNDKAAQAMPAAGLNAEFERAAAAMVAARKVRAVCYDTLGEPRILQSGENPPPKARQLDELMDGLYALDTIASLLRAGQREQERFDDAPEDASEKQTSNPLSSRAVDGLLAANSIILHAMIVKVEQVGEAGAN